MLTYADACGRMLTHADVCSGMVYKQANTHRHARARTKRILEPLLYTCPHTNTYHYMCPRTTTCLPYCIQARAITKRTSGPPHLPSCPTAAYVSRHCYLYTCPHTPTHVSHTSHTGTRNDFPAPPPHTFLRLLYTCPHTNTCHYIFVLVLLHVFHTAIQAPATIPPPPNIQKTLPIGTPTRHALSQQEKKMAMKGEKGGGRRAHKNKREKEKGGLGRTQSEMILHVPLQHSHTLLTQTHTQTRTHTHTRSRVGRCLVVILWRVFVCW
jgi:hypothetical protein